MSALMGLRIALATGREGRLRFGLMVLGTGIGTVLVLLTLIVMPALQGRIDRYAWHRTDTATPATAADPALWLPVTDRYNGRSIVRFQVAALGERPPVPPGLEHLPEAGEVFVSPALAELIASAPEDELAARFPGEIVGVIEPDGLVSPDELVAVIGRAPDELREIRGTMMIRGIEEPADRLDLDAFVQALVAFIAVLLVGPVVVFVMMATRIDAARREQRFAALRLAGATRWQTGVIAVAETAGAAIVGTALGFLGFQALMPVLQARIFHEGLRFSTADFQAPTGPMVLVVVAIPLVAVTTALVTLQRAQISPLGARRQVTRRPPTPWRLLPLAVGFGLTCLLGLASSAAEPHPALAVLGLVAALSLLIGTYLAGGYVCMWVGRGLARLSFSAPALIAARRIATDPYATFRAIGGVALAAMVATIFATTAGVERTEIESSPVTLDDGVVLVLTRGAPEAALAPLLAHPGAVVAREQRGVIGVSCADLSSVTTFDCPMPQTEAVDSDLFTLFAGVPFVRDLQDAPLGPWQVADPSGDETGSIHSILVPTDGTTAGIERVRTEAMLAAPYGLARTSDDWVAGRLAASSTGYARIFQVAMLFVIVVAACSLTVSVIATMVERRRPFALLRAAGMPLGQLRQLTLFETAIPLVVTALVGVALGLGQLVVLFLLSSASPDASQVAWPDLGFFATAGIGLVAAVAVSLLSWPLMDTVTRHDSVRYE